MWNDVSRVSEVKWHASFHWQMCRIDWDRGTRGWQLMQECSGGRTTAARRLTTQVQTRSVNEKNSIGHTTKSFYLLQLTLDVNKQSARYGTYATNIMIIMSTTTPATIPIIAPASILLTATLKTTNSNFGKAAL